MCGADLDLRGGSRLAGRICGGDVALESGSVGLIEILRLAGRICGTVQELRGGSGLASRICGADLAWKSGSAELIKILI